MEFKNLLVEIEDGIAVVTINRPKALNALNTETLSELDACFADIEANPDVKVLILTGSGQKSFVAGADISEMVNGTAPEGRTFGLLALLSSALRIWKSPPSLQSTASLWAAAARSPWLATLLWLPTMLSSVSLKLAWASSPASAAHRDFLV